VRGRRGELPLLARADSAPDRTAIVADDGRFSYAELVEATRRVAAGLLAGSSDLNEGRVALMVPPGLRFVATQWATWSSGGVSVPLCLTHPGPELDHVVADSDAAMIVSSAEFRELLEPIARRRRVPLIDVDDLVSLPPPEVNLPEVDMERRALILYTSGTTGTPKGVVWTHAGIRAQTQILSDAWGWTSTDHALLVLPLHHVHGLVNVVTTALWNTATCEMLPRFDVVRTWDRLVSGDISVFMAVPTIYHSLIAAWEEAEDALKEATSQVLPAMRLMVSGSAALPVPTLEAWRRISGHTLLERYGMTEIGMALSNPYHGTRTPGAVGAPLPDVDVRIVDGGGLPVPPGVTGEVEVKGPSVFREYWRRPEATSAAFRDGWFRTGDEAVVEGDVYRILGRQSVDIIKTGGEKVSALEVEEVLRAHPAIRDCAVVGIADPRWGERVVVALVAAGEAPTLEDLRAFASDRLAPYKVPRSAVVVDDLPRNAMGKVVKPSVRDLFAEE